MTNGGGRDEIWEPSLGDETTDSEAEEDWWFDRDFEPFEIPPEIWERRWARQARERLELEVFGPPRKRRRLRELARATVENEKSIIALEAACGALDGAVAEDPPSAPKRHPVRPRAGVWKRVREFLES